MLITRVQIYLILTNLITGNNINKLNKVEMNTLFLKIRKQTVIS